VARIFRVFLVDDDVIVRRALRELVESDADLEVVGQAAGVNQALTQVPLCHPDVALLDDRLPDGNGFDLCRDLRSRLPDLQCIIFASFSSTDVMLNAVQAGASGCIIRNAKGVEVLTAIKAAAAGDCLLDIGVATAWLVSRAREDFLDAVWVLTEQEGELLSLLVAGHTDSQIALRMRLDDKAFRACLRTLISKAQTRRDAHAPTGPIGGSTEDH
jgi:two-component system response regulator DevR